MVSIGTDCGVEEMLAGCQLNVTPGAREHHSLPEARALGWHLRGGKTPGVAGGAASGGGGPGINEGAGWARVRVEVFSFTMLAPNGGGRQSANSRGKFTSGSSHKLSLGAAGSAFVTTGGGGSLATVSCGNCKVTSSAQDFM
jgi:hypothetical protein